jgi:pyroglutamyl-peptidase
MMERMMGEPCVLLTGFEPFGGEHVNPSQEIVRALDGEIVQGHRLVGATLPVAFAATLPHLENLLRTRRPALVLALGQAGGRSELSLERVAINLIDARIADNDGAQPIDTAIVAGAPHAYFTTLPIKAIEARLRALGIPAGTSLSAGSFVCNQAFYALMHLLAMHYPDVRGGFIHVPWLPQQATSRPGQPSMALTVMIEGVRAALGCALSTSQDLHVAGGTVA